MNPKKTEWAFEPMWARAYFNYLNWVPAHRGKSWALRQILRIGKRRGEPFVWKMLNGNSVAISPFEGEAAWSVGWTCFLTRTWEPHVERILKLLARPGDSVMDIGANIGYFSNVLARAVGESGRVWSFEPVPATYQQLCIAKETNKFNQIVPLQIALGDATGEVTIRFRKEMMGSASANLYHDDPLSESTNVLIRRLDDLWNAGEVGLPSLIKIDVEGHEYAALSGAKEIIKTSKPTILFEYNFPAAKAAGWDFHCLARYLLECGPYHFYQIRDSKVAFERIDPESYALTDCEYADFIASVSPLQDTPVP